MKLIKKHIDKNWKEIFMETSVSFLLVFTLVFLYFVFTTI